MALSKSAPPWSTDDVESAVDPAAEATEPAINRSLPSRVAIPLLSRVEGPLCIVQYPAFSDFLYWKAPCEVSSAASVTPGGRLILI